MQQSTQTRVGAEDLCVSGLTVSTSGYQIVRGISFAVSKGEMLAIAGESGSGKSVSCLAALRLLPDALKIEGAITYRGQDVAAMDEDALRRFHAASARVVFQDPWSALNPLMTIGEQLIESARSAQDMPHTEAHARAVAALEMVGVSDCERRMKSRPRELSGGLLQRVVIAMALLGNPGLLICDEPTTALDVTTETQIMELIRELNRNLGTSVILTTHDLGLIADYCDRIIVMYAGRIVEVGAVEQCFRDPLHPYTRSLLNSMPGVGPGTPFSQLATIEGQPPSPTENPPGCSFAPRCPKAFERCWKERPSLTARGDERALAACWLMESRQ